MTTFERNEDCATVFLKWTDFRSRNHPFIRQQKDRVGIEKVWNCVDVIKVETTKMCDLIFYRFKARKMFEWCDSNSNISAVVVILLNFPIEYFIAVYLFTYVIFELTPFRSIIFSLKSLEGNRKWALSTHNVR